MKKTLFIAVMVLTFAWEASAEIRIMADFPLRQAQAPPKSASAAPHIIVPRAYYQQLVPGSDAAESVQPLRLRFTVEVAQEDIGALYAFYRIKNQKAQNFTDQVLRYNNNFDDDSRISAIDHKSLGDAIYFTPLVPKNKMDFKFELFLPVSSYTVVQAPDPAGEDGLQMAFLLSKIRFDLSQPLEQEPFALEIRPARFDLDYAISDSADGEARLRLDIDNANVDLAVFDGDSTVVAERQSPFNGEFKFVPLAEEGSRAISLKIAPRFDWQFPQDLLQQENRYIVYQLNQYPDAESRFYEMVAAIREQSQKEKQKKQVAELPPVNAPAPAEAEGSSSVSQQESDRINGKLVVKKLKRKYPGIAYQEAAGIRLTIPPKSAISVILDDFNQAIADLDYQPVDPKQLISHNARYQNQAFLSPLKTDKAGKQVVKLGNSFYNLNRIQANATLYLPLEKAENEILSHNAVILK